MLTAMLVDDEYYALEGLKVELEMFHEVKVVGMYEGGKSAVENIARLRPSVVFLDIDMPEMTGLELFDSLLEISPTTHIVFVTAYKEYAVKAFELNAVDYIVKPIRKERLKKTIDRICEKYEPLLLNRRISIDCFGHLSIKIDGKEADIPWRTKKAEELLAYLICNEGSFISKEKVAEVLWPGIDMEKSKSNFYLAYHYLKKQTEELGVHFPLESTRGKIRFKIEDIELDIIRFKEELEYLETITDENINRAEKAIIMYKGMLLGDHYYEWCKELEQYFHIMYIDLLKKVIDYYKEKKNIEKMNYYFNRLEAN